CRNHRDLHSFPTRRSSDLELAEAGYEALKTLPYYNHFFKTTNPWTVELAAKLARLLPNGHEHILFANSGSEANDSALKLIRYYRSEEHTSELQSRGHLVCR